MEGVPVPSLYPLSPANPVVMNVVLSSLYMIRCWGVWRHPDPGNIVSLWTSLQEERDWQDGVGIPGLLQERQIQLRVISNFLY